MEAWVNVGDSLPVTAFASSSTQSLTTQAATVRVGATTSTAAAVTVDNFQLDSAAWPVQLSGGVSRTFTHDGLGRVVSAAEGNYTYDQSGNVTSNPAIASASYNAADQATGTWNYDSRGNITDFGFVWDSLDRLTARGTTTSLYAGRTLIGEVKAGTPVTYTQDTSGGLSQMLQTRTGSGSATSYVYGQSGERLAEVSSSGVRTWDLADDRGSLRSQLPDSGVPSGRASYSAYGLPTKEGTISSNFGWLGEQFDGSWNMTWMRSRWMDNGYSFFYGRDRVKPGNPYRYASDSPLMKTDRTGDYDAGDGACGPGRHYQPPKGCMPDGYGKGGGGGGSWGGGGGGGTWAPAPRRAQKGTQHDNRPPGCKESDVLDRILRAAGAGVPPQDPAEEFVYNAETGAVEQTGGLEIRDARVTDIPAAAEYLKSVGASTEYAIYIEYGMHMLIAIQGGMVKGLVAVGQTPGYIDLAMNHITVPGAVKALRVQTVAEVDSDIQSAMGEALMQYAASKNAKGVWGSSRAGQWDAFFEGAQFTEINATERILNDEGQTVAGFARYGRFLDPKDLALVMRQQEIVMRLAKEGYNVSGTGNTIVDSEGAVVGDIDANGIPIIDEAGNPTFMPGGSDTVTDPNPIIDGVPPESGGVDPELPDLPEIEPPIVP